MKLFKPCYKTEIRKYAFSKSVIDDRNSLTENIYKNFRVFRYSQGMTRQALVYRMVSYLQSSTPQNIPLLFSFFPILLSGHHRTSIFYPCIIDDDNDDGDGNDDDDDDDDDDDNDDDHCDRH